jgi:molybdopterin-guanine dinucleotide biosynthesis protein B
MRLIISIVGKSGSGKTTLLESLISELKRRGHKVAIIKHSHHADDLDTEKKDTWRFTRAGSVLSAINSLDNLAVFRQMDHYFDPREISDFILWDYDILLTEGFKGSNYPKIEVHRHDQGEELLTDPSLLLAIITDVKLDVDVPQYSRDDIAGIADVIEKNVAERQEENDAELVVNGEVVPLTQPLKDLLVRTMTAMIPAPPDGKIKNFHFSLRRKA